MDHAVHDNSTTEYDIDPVCGMKVAKERTDKPSFDYHGEHYRFCNPKCRLVSSQRGRSQQGWKGALYPRGGRLAWPVLRAA